ncbi:MAG: hypothetical protein U9N49_02670 [Campylobacterota bacterium]|nr:hypothetical protein [Campylobacterota bacterium]
MIELKLLILLLVAYHTIKIYYDSKRKYPPLDYSNYSTANSEPWRWRKPSEDIALSLRDDENSSHIFLEGKALMAEKIFMLIGYGLIAIIFFGFIKRLFFMDIPLIGSDYVIFLVFLLLGYGALNIGKYVTRVILYQDKIEFVEQYGFFFQRITSYTRSPKLSFESRKEHFLELTSDHNFPRTRLRVKNGWFALSKLYNLACNPTQAHWIVEGLEAWQKES